MKPAELIEKAKIDGRAALNEAESKQFLAYYGVPVVEERIAGTPDEAAKWAEAIGFPIVVKGLGATLTHKTERGLVKTGLAGAEAVTRAALEIREAAGEGLEGWLVQPQLKGRREFVAGIFHDDQFGPVIMFGLGGVFTEALDDVVFRVAPVDEGQAAQMLDEIRARDLLGAFRGEPAVNREDLIKTITGLSRLAEEHAAVTEVDINPLLITSEGNPVAVDALVVLGELKPAAPVRPPAGQSAVWAMLNPKSIAFVGATSQFGNWGHLLFTNVIAGGYVGGIHLVNPNRDFIAGRTVYKSVIDIPGPVDLAVVTIPASRVLALIPEFRAKGIKSVLLISSGFREIGPEGKKLEDTLVEEARKNEILIMGPNTMGMANPHQKLYCMGTSARPTPGSMAFISQSGNLGYQLISILERQGIGIRAFVGSGNEAMLTIEDALETFAGDDLTSTIFLYIESIKNGRRFLDLARRVSREKPIVAIKGGRTQAGKRAAASHTGALASNARVFEAVCRQAGIMSVIQPTDLLDLAAAFSSLPLPKGRRVAIMTPGAGLGVIAADLCTEYGLEVPELSSELIDRIDRYLPPFWSRSNPVDLVGERDPDLPLKVISELFKWDGCDAVITVAIMDRPSFLESLTKSIILTDPGADPGNLDLLRQTLNGSVSNYIAQLARLIEEYGKPVVDVSMSSDKTLLHGGASRYRGMFFQTPYRAVRVIARMCEYKQWLDRNRT
jgi:acyl-CoA synthetase (NDP forming)